MRSHCLGLIRQVYGDDVVKRSQVPLMNHIYEGITVLDHLGASEEAVCAYIVHPIFQNDQNLLAVASSNDALEYVKLPARVVLLAMEYRKTANACLPAHKQNGVVTRPKKSVLEEVNDMLIADKIQNKKDFMVYHYGTHSYSGVLYQYFNNWLKELGINQEDERILNSVIDEARTKRNTYIPEKSVS